MPPIRAETRTRPVLLSVPSGVPFLETLAEALLDGGLVPGLDPLKGDPLALSEALIFLPTRRAAREFEAIVAERLGGAALLPRVLTLGGFGEDEDAFEDDATRGAVIGETERRLVLATLEQVGGDKSKAAEILGISLKTLYNRLNVYAASHGSE